MKLKEMKYQKERKVELLYKKEYKGFNYYIYSMGTHPCAYVEIPKDHKLAGKFYGEIDLDVHGGLTYSDMYLHNIKNGNWFIGWDYAHAGDYMGFYSDEPFKNMQSIIDDKKWTTKEMIEDCKNCIEQIIERY